MLCAGLGIGIAIAGGVAGASCSSRRQRRPTATGSQTRRRIGGSWISSSRPTWPAPVVTWTPSWTPIWRRPAWAAGAARPAAGRPGAGRRCAAKRRPTETRPPAGPRSTELGRPAPGLPSRAAAAVVRAASSHVAVHVRVNEGQDGSVSGLAPPPHPLPSLFVKQSVACPFLLTRAWI